VYLHIVTMLWAGQLGFNSWQVQGNGLSYLMATTSRPSLGPTQPHIHWVLGALSLGLRPGHEADHLPPSSAEIKNACNYTPTPQYVFMALCLTEQCMCLHSMVLSYSWHKNSFILHLNVHSEDAFF